ncbi:MAG: hypothetical protein AAGA02_11795 [Bacteroidota bacterium]
MAYLEFGVFRQKRAKLTGWGIKIMEKHIFMLGSWRVSEILFKKTDQQKAVLVKDNNQLLRPRKDLLIWNHR